MQVEQLNPEFPTPSQIQFLKEMGYEEIIDRIEIFRSRKQGFNLNRAYYGLIEKGERIWIAWTDGELKPYAEWLQTYENSKDPLDRRIQSMELNIARLTTLNASLQARVAAVEARFIAFENRGGSTSTRAMK